MGLAGVQGGKERDGLALGMTDAGLTRQRWGSCREFRPQG